MRLRRMAQIVRDFMEAFVLAREIGEGLRNGSLDFSSVERLVGDAEDNVLFRLKEECHALFRLNDARSRTEVQAEELFDLAVGALFHETMKFREGYYLTASYGPRLQRMVAEGSASGPLADTFERAFEAGRRRMMESEAEASDLFRETRDQLLIVLRQSPPSGAVARSLVENPERTAAVFKPVDELLIEIYGSAELGYELAVDSLLENGHFSDARAILARDEVVRLSHHPYVSDFAQGMEAYYSGDNYDAVELLARWINDAPTHPPAWCRRADRVLTQLAATAEQLDPKLSEEAAELARRIRPASVAETVPVG